MVLGNKLAALVVKVADSQPPTFVTCSLLIALIWFTLNAGCDMAAIAPICCVVKALIWVVVNACDMAVVKAVMAALDKLGKAAGLMLANDCVLIADTCPALNTPTWSGFRAATAAVDKAPTCNANS